MGSSTSHNPLGLHGLLQGELRWDTWWHDKILNQMLVHYFTLVQCCFSCGIPGLPGSLELVSIAPAVRTEDSGMPVFWKLKLLYRCFPFYASFGCFCFRVALCSDPWPCRHGSQTSAPNKIHPFACSYALYVPWNFFKGTSVRSDHGLYQWH
jgi:hypothetical protein